MLAENKSNLLAKLQEGPLDDASSSRASCHPGEHHYDSYFEYILSLIGFAVGFGSFWRFPYLVYKNGGGAFLIPYFIAMFLLGVPMLYLQTGVGQMHQRTLPFIFARINKGFKLIGGTFMFTCFHLAGFYNIILTYSYRFVFSAFESQLPFSKQSPQQSNYFQNVILQKSSSINEFGSINPFLFFLYCFSLYVCYMVVKKGVKSSGKIIIFTALMPYFFFSVMLIRAFFLEGSYLGLRYLLIPDFSKLFAIEIWIDAIVQVFFQMNTACSGIINLSSLKPKREKFMIGVYLIPLSLIICGMMCALNIFMYLGHFCYEYNLEITNLTLSGPQLSFNIFPKALAVLPWPNLWILCFFVTMVFLGIDSQFGFLESLFSFLKDENESKGGCISIFGWKLTVDKAKMYLIILILVFAPFLTSSAGIYYLSFFDSFVSTIPLSFGALIEYFFFVKYFPLSELQRQCEKQTGEKTPKWIKSLLEGKVVLFILLINMGVASLNQFFYFFRYSFGFYIFGWFITGYPYVIAYFYWRKNKESKDRLTFEELKQKSITDL